MMTLLFTFIPLVGLVFNFTNTVGAALWAADIEARENLIEGGGRRSQTTTNPSEPIRGDSSKVKAD